MGREILQIPLDPQYYVNLFRNSVDEIDALPSTELNPQERAQRERVLTSGAIHAARQLAKTPKGYTTLEALIRIAEGIQSSTPPGSDIERRNNRDLALLRQGLKPQPVAARVMKA